MLDLRNTLLDLPTLKHRLHTDLYENLINDCRKFPDDPVMQIMASFWIMSEAILETYPNQLHHQLYGRLGIYTNLYPEIATLLSEVKHDNSGLHLTQSTLQPAYRGLHRLLHGHTEQIVGAKVLSNNRILTWAWDKTLRLWSANGDLLAIMEGHTDLLKEAIELSTGRILSWSNNLDKQDTSLRMWSADGELLAVLRGHVEDRPSEVIELPNGNILSKVYHEQYYLLWDSEGQLIRKIDLEHEDIHKAVVIGGNLIGYDHPMSKIYTFDGEYIGIHKNLSRNFLTGRFLELADSRFISWVDNSLFFHDSIKSISHQLELNDERSQRYITSVTLLQDDRLLVYCSNTRPRRKPEFELFLITLAGTQIKHIEEETRYIRHIHTLENGRLLLSMSDNQLELWSGELEHLTNLKGHTSGWMKDILELDDGRLVTFYNDETIRIWTADGEALGVIGGQAAGVKCAGILKNGRIVSYAHSEFSYDKTVSIWNLEADETQPAAHHTSYAYRIIELHDGRILSCSWDATMMIWSSNGHLIQERWSKYMGSVRDAMELSDGRILVWSGRSAILSADGGLLEPLENTIYGAIQLTNGRIVTYGWQDIRIWTAGMIELYAVEKHKNPIAGIIQLSEERILSWEVNAEKKNEPVELYIWSDDGELLKTLSGHTKAIHGALELTNGRILTWSADKRLQLWSSDGDLLTVMIAHNNPIYDAFELTNGCVLSSYQSNDNKVENENLLWTSNGEFIRQINEDRGYIISQGQDEIYWDKDGNRLMGYQQGKLVQEFVAETSIIAYCGTRDGGVALGDFRGSVHILKPQ